MKYLKNKISLKSLILFGTVISMTVFASCGSDDNGDEPTVAPTTQELVINALNGSNVALSTTASIFPADVVITTASATVIASEAGAVNITIGGDLATYISGGSFSVESDGSISAAAVTAAIGSELAISNPSATVNSELTTLTMSFQASVSSGRSNGLGSWSLSIAL